MSSFIRISAFGIFLSMSVSLLALEEAAPETLQEAQENESSIFSSPLFDEELASNSQFTIAVMPMENVSLEPEVAYHFRQRVIQLLIAKGFTVIDSGWIDDALYELGLTHAGQLRLLSHAQLAEAVKADAFFFGIVEEARTQNAAVYNAYVYKSSLKLDRADGEVLWYSLEQRVTKRRFAADPINALIDVLLVKQGGDAKEAVGALADRLMDPMPNGPVNVVIGDSLLDMAMEVAVVSTSGQQSESGLLADLSGATEADLNTVYGVASEASQASEITEEEDLLSALGAATEYVESDSAQPQEVSQELIQEGSQEGSQEVSQEVSQENSKEASEPNESVMEAEDLMSALSSATEYIEPATELVTESESKSIEENNSVSEQAVNENSVMTKEHSEAVLDLSDNLTKSHSALANSQEIDISAESESIADNNEIPAITDGETFEQSIMQFSQDEAQLEIVETESGGPINVVESESFEAVIEDAMSLKESESASSSANAVELQTNSEVDTAQDGADQSESSGVKGPLEEVDVSEQSITPDEEANEQSKEQSVEESQVLQNECPVEESHLEDDVPELEEPKNINQNNDSVTDTAEQKSKATCSHLLVNRTKVQGDSMLADELVSAPGNQNKTSDKDKKEPPVNEN